MIKSKILKHNNQIVLSIDGKISAPLAYMSYSPPNATYELFHDYKINLYSTGVYFTDKGVNPLSLIKQFRSNIWVSEEEYNFSILDEDFERIVNGQDNVYIIPRVCVDSPDWWDKKYPEELALDYSNKTIRQSLASEKWMSDCKKNLKLLVEYIENSKWSKNVIGYHIAAGGTEELFHPYDMPIQYQDYSENNRCRFISFLKDNYKDIDSINRAWGRSFSEFEEVRIPDPFEREHSFNDMLRDPATQQNAIDFYRYHSEIIADNGIELCKYVKELTDNQQVAGVFYGYIYHVTDVERGHHCLYKILKSPYVDFCASPFHYSYTRGYGIDWPFMSAVDSFHLNNKLWFVEADVRTSETKYLKDSIPSAAPDVNHAYEEPIWRSLPSEEVSLNQLKKAFARVLCSQIGAWWFDMWGGWFANDYYREFFQISTLTYNRQMQEMHSTKVAQIAVLLDETSYFYLKPKAEGLEEMVNEQLRELGKSGAPYHTYEFSDFDDIPFENYKMVFFINICGLNSDEREKIDTIKNGNRTLVFSYLPDMYGAETSVSEIEYEIKNYKEPLQVAFGNGLYPVRPVRDTGITIDESDKDICCIGKSLDGNRYGLVYKKFDNWTSVLSIAPGICARALTKLAVMSGVFVYSFDNDVLYANSNFVALHAASDGVKRVYFPRTCFVKEIYSGVVSQKKVSIIEVECKMGDSYLWEISRDS